MFTVVIPLHNKAFYIKKAVQSVLNQSYSQYELIVINDGSTDDSLEKVKDIKDKRLKIIEQSNQGVSAARNTGVKLAQNDYIAFLDADDWWHLTFLEEMALLLGDFPDAGIYGCQYFWVKNGNQKKSINHKPANFRGYINYFDAYIYAWWMPLTSISVVIRKKVFDDLNGFKDNLKFGEDFDLWIRIVLKHKVAYLNKPLAYYNQDVVVKDRALGGKSWKKEEHFLFNLSYLDEVERENNALKKLLDGLRVRGLLNFYLRNDYPSEVKALLSKVDFKLQPAYYQRLYHWPKPMILFYLKSKKVGSVIKQFLLKSMRQK